MDDDLDDGPDVAFDPNAATASLGFLCSDPKGVATDGEWVLLLEDGGQRPLLLAHIGLSLDHQQAPIALAEEALTNAGYEHTRLVVTRPWAARWRVITEADRLPRPDAP